MTTFDFSTEIKKIFFLCIAGALIGGAIYGDRQPPAKSHTAIAYR